MSEGFSFVSVAIPAKPSVAIAIPIPMAAMAATAGLAASFASLQLQDTTASSARLAKSTFSGVSLRSAVKVAPLRVSARTIPIVRAAMAGAMDAESVSEGKDLEAWVKQNMPGGFAAQRLMGTGRRKTAVARVVLLDGTGQIIINNRTAQVRIQFLLLHSSFLGACEFPARCALTRRMFL